MLFVAFCANAQEHKWAGRTLDNFEWTIHERLAVLPSYGVFDTLRFEVQGQTVILSGQVVKDSVKQNAERMLGAAGWRGECRKSDRSFAFIQA